MSDSVPFSAFVLGVGITVIGIARFLDSNLTEQSRQRISQFLRTGNLPPMLDGRSVARPWQAVASAVTHFFSEVLQANHAKRFVRTSIALSLTIILTAFVFFYWHGEDADIESIFASGRTILFALALPLLATLLIDVISAYQTILFLEMIGQCRSLWQVVVLVYSNLIVSIGLFSLLFPLVVIVLLVAENSRLRSDVLQLQLYTTSQVDNRAMAILSTFGAGKFGRTVTEDAVVWRVGMKGGNADDDASPSRFLNVLSSREYKAINLLPFLVSSFRALASDGRVKVVSASYQNGFINLPSGTINVNVHNLSDGVPLVKLYRIAFNQTNLFGVRSIEMVGGALLPIEAGNSLAYELLLGGPDASVFTTNLDCDGVISRLQGNNIEQAIAQCKSWSAVSDTVLKLSLLGLDDEATPHIFIAPFALSSLTTTIVIYALCLVLLYTYCVRSALPRLSNLGIINIENVPLTLAATLAWVFFLLPIAGVGLLAGH